MTYNNARETFPNVVFAGMFGFQAAEHLAHGAHFDHRFTGVRSAFIVFAQSARAP